MSVAAPVSVFAEVVAQPGKREQVLDAARTAFASVEGEPGTVIFSIHVCEEEPDSVRFYELYEDADAKAAHSGSEAVATLIGALGDLLAAPPRIVVTTPVIAKGHASDGSR
jgi:quinol monooxygenase YgiN